MDLFHHSGFFNSFLPSLLLCNGSIQQYARKLYSSPWIESRLPNTVLDNQGILPQVGVPHSLSCLLSTPHGHLKAQPYIQHFPCSVNNFALHISEIMKVIRQEPPNLLPICTYKLLPFVSSFSLALCFREEVIGPFLSKLGQLHQLSTPRPPISSRTFLL